VTRRRIAVAAALAAAATLAIACSSSGAPGSSGGEAAPPAAAAEIERLVEQMEDTHPDLFRSVSRADFHRAADELVASLPELSRSEALVGVMKLVALAGARNGHTGVFPLGQNARPFRLYPIQLYRFSDGLFVIGELGAEGLAGSRLVEIQGLSVAEVEARARPAVARDNDWDLAARLPEFLVTADVLHGLGVTPTEDSAAFTFESPAGARRTVTLQPVGAGAYAAAFGLGGRINAVPNRPAARQPRYLRLADRRRWIATLHGGRTIVAAYNQTSSAWDLARELVRRARSRKVRRIVVDLRLNQGGDNTQYSELLQALRRPVVSRAGRLRVLIGRHTYSAAGNLAADIDASTRARLVGEPTGGSPSNWGDSTQIALPSLGVTAYVATSYQQFGDENALAVGPNLRVELASADYFAGRDPVLEAALR
jgi:Peptidase family S41